MFHSQVAFRNKDEPRLFEQVMLLNAIIMAMEQQILFAFISDGFRIQTNELEKRNQKNNRANQKKNNKSN